MAQSSPSGPSDAQQELKDFWVNVANEIRNLTTADLRTQELPLARIKKIMKLDEDVKMISAEAPVLFAKAAEIFIHELTLRAWIHTEDNKRRTLQRNDIAMAITKYDQFDFLIDIVPRDELKPVKKDDNKNATTVVGAEQVSYYLQLAQQHQAALQGASTGAVQIVQQAVPGVQTIQLVQSGTGQTQAVNNYTLMQQPQIISQHPQQQTILQLQGNQFQQPQQQTVQTGGLQLVQQVVGPNGEVQTVPIQLNAAQMQMLRMQLQGATTPTSSQGQSIILQTSPIQQTSASVLTAGQNGAQIIHS
ncbi:unnamed protein product [Allacma fusca]|uniref:Nuclear transcription factor Y subunit gamma n=1 Tax=Allacma fusca TaxID=39272 RepID=A0A8J2PU00_9HEXA|nr:unnamed protein product [Allacma fusca]